MSSGIGDLCAWGIAESVRKFFQSQVRSLRELSESGMGPGVP